MLPYFQLAYANPVATGVFLVIFLGGMALCLEQLSLAFRRK